MIGAILVTTTTIAVVGAGPEPFTREPRTDEVQSWLTAQPVNELAISDWVITEFSSALSLKLRTEQLSPKNRADALALFNTIVEESLTRLGVSGRDFHTAARYADDYKTGLRAGDALHLAIAINHGANLITLDKGLAKAAETLGVSTELL